MSDSWPSLPTARNKTNEKDASKHVDDADTNLDSGDLNDALGKEVRGALKQKKKARANRRGNRARAKAKKLSELAAVQEANDNNDADDDVSMTGLSEADTVATELLSEPYQPRPLPPEPYVYVPLVTDYEYRVVPAAAGGSSGGSMATMGLFATKDIAKGARIICEPPLLALPAPGDQPLQLYSAYQQLHGHEQAAIWNLTPSASCASPLLTQMAKTIALQLAPILAINQKRVRRRTEAENALLSTSLPMLAQACEIFRLCARWHANRFQLTPHADSSWDNLAPNAPVSGLFPEASKLRHSCVPNSHAQFNAARTRLTVHVTSAIPAGDELTLSVLSNVYLLPLAPRTHKLHAMLGLSCRCEACDASHARFHKHQHARQAAYTRSVHLRHLTTALDTHASDAAAVRQSLHLPAAMRAAAQPPSYADLHDAEKTCIALCRNLRDSGCAGLELVRWYMLLVERVQPVLGEGLSEEEKRRYGAVMLARVRECEEIARCCCGEDSVEMREMRGRRERVERFLSMG